MTDFAGPVAPPLVVLRKRRRWATPLFTAAGFCVGIAFGVVIGGFSGGEAATDTDDAAPPSPSANETADTRLADAYATCVGSGDGFELADDDTTLILDTMGADDSAGTDITTLGCALGELATPTRVITAMESTRALDGRQSESWDGFTAAWSYHPDSGMDVIITLDEES